MPLPGHVGEIEELFIHRLTRGFNLSTLSQTHTPAQVVQMIAQTYEGLEQIGETFHFTSTPETISDRAGLQFQGNRVDPATARPIRFYGGTDSRTVTLQLHLWTHGDPQKDVVDRGNWLRSLQYPVVLDRIPTSGVSVGRQRGGVDVNFGRGNAPPQLVVQFGDLFTLPCIAQDVTVTWKGPWETGGRSFLPHFADVDMTFLYHPIDAQEYPSMQSVARGEH